VHFSTEDTPLVISLEHNNYNTGLSVAEVQHAFDLIAKAVTRLAIVADFVEAKVALLTVITHVGVIALALHLFIIGYCSTCKYSEQFINGTSAVVKV